ncbi:MAG: hypothetical protein IKL55_05280 [Clostridia bacterium]|nr:hypothetical protein [Clostridia bacterium]
MNKKIVFIFGIICIIIFLIFYYIFCITGNNIIRNQNEFVEDMLKDLEEYEANIEVTIRSNKNENTYSMYQIVDEEYSKLLVNSPENVRGLEIELKDGKLKMINEKTNMEKIYENYETIINNDLFINSFIDEYKKYEVEISENEVEIIVKVEREENKNIYIKSKELYLDKKTRLPKKLLLKDNSQNINTSIIYTDIKIK